MRIVDIWINCPTVEAADTIAERLIEARLVACANLYEPVRSAYHWNGGVERETEHPLLVKTRDELGDLVEAAGRTMHPYEVPAIIRVAIDSVNADYLAWVYAETRDP